MSRRGWTLTAAGIAAAAALLHITGAADAIPFDGIRERLSSVKRATARALHDAEAVAQPAPLHPLHRDEPELRECGACHTLTSGIRDEGCLACHEEVGARIADGLGHHGRDLRGACPDCHGDHGAPLLDFDREAFNHARALFPLEGRHASVECEACHETETDAAAQPVRLRFLGIAFERCIDCHEDPHRGDLSREGMQCTACHDQEQWDGRHLRFVHERDSAFVLRGAHAALDCEACHIPPEGAPLGAAPFTGIGQGCADCHEDPHRGELSQEGRECQACHDQEKWDGEHVASLHGSDAKFPLRAAHAELACTACHAHQEGAPLASARFLEAGTDCADCHSDPHLEQFADDRCERCHGEDGWTGRELRFRHDEFEPYPLTGAHAAVACGACHAPADESLPLAAGPFRGAPADCAACHEDPHEGSLAAQSCAECHSTVAWRGPALSFDHADSAFPLDALHAPLDCAECHTSPVYRPTPTDCAECHADYSGFLEGRVKVGAAVEAWAPSPHAGKVSCQDCHEASVKAPEDVGYAERCAACHTPHYATLHLDRAKAMAELGLELRRLMEEQGAATEDLAGIAERLRVGSHDYAEAERRTRALLEAARAPR